MGGRGTFAAGNSVAYSYQTVGYVEGVKVLQGTNGKHSLPESSHSSKAYIKLKPDGTFHEMRFYNKDHVLYMEIVYHPEKSLTGNNHTPILHYHLYDDKFSKNGTGAFKRTNAAVLTDKMIKKYKKYLRGIKI